MVNRIYCIYIENKCEEMYQKVVRSKENMNKSYKTDKRKSIINIFENRKKIWNTKEKNL